MRIPENVTKEQLINDLIKLRQRINELEKIEADKKKYEQELAKTKAMFEGLFEFAPDAIIVVDRRGHIVQANKQAERLFGYSREELLSADHDMLLPQRFRDKHRESRAGYMSEPRTRPMGTGLELYGRKKDGSEFPVDIALGPLQAEKEVVVLAVVRDFTERKLAEEKLARAFAELQRSNRDLEQFAYGVSHDLKEPLRKIASFTDLLAKRFKEKLGDDADRYIHYIVDGAERMLGLIDDVLTYSRVGTGTKPFVPVDSNELVRQVLSDMQQTIGASGAAVMVDRLPVVTADKTELTRVFQNLIDNAVKFRRAEPLRVRISAKRKESEWHFSVSDNGIGIASEFLDRIFVVFQRLHTREEYGGTGIGLAVCRKAVERHGGRIWAESESGKGSVFYFTIPDAARGDPK